MIGNMTLEDRMFGRFPPDANEDDIRRYYDHIFRIHERAWNERMGMHMSGPKLVDEAQWMVFMAQDNAFAETLPIYRNICKIMGADQEHLDCVDRTIERMKRWRQEHPDKCKVPDAKGERLLG